MHRKLVIQFLLAVLLLVQAACATGPRSVEVSQQQIEAALARRFPHETRVAELLVLKIAAPRLTLLPDANRVRLDFAIEASDRLSRQAVQGELGLSFALRYEPSDASLRLANVRAEHVELQGIPAAWRATAQRAAMIVAEQMLDGAPLRTFRPEEIARANGWTPGEIRVTPRGLRIELLPPVH